MKYILLVLWIFSLIGSEVSQVIAAPLSASGPQLIQGNTWIWNFLGSPSEKDGYELTGDYHSDSEEEYYDDHFPTEYSSDSDQENEDIESLKRARAEQQIAQLNEPGNSKKDHKEVRELQKTKQNFKKSKKLSPIIEEKGPLTTIEESADEPHTSRKNFLHPSVAHLIHHKHHNPPVNTTVPTLFPQLDPQKPHSPAASSTSEPPHSTSSENFSITIIEPKKHSSLWKKIFPFNKTTKTPVKE